ncbi:hypothetical protein B7494_g1140 [Chlorociboria aeruginascens]|nr:hypothetical protein B7494_g1140 [Chlorociboria aeruginascens]
MFEVGPWDIDMCYCIVDCVQGVSASGLVRVRGSSFLPSDPLAREGNWRCGAGSVEMHYIRFLKLPRRDSRGGKGMVSAKITVTTDLGEAFLREDLVLIVGVCGADGRGIGKRREVLWKGRDGMRSLEVVLPLEEKVRGVRMMIRPKEEKFSVEKLEALVSRGEGKGIAGVVAGRWITAFFIPVLSSPPFILYAFSDTIKTSSPVPHNPPLPPITQHPRARAGCGIVGITLSKLLSLHSKILLTDLPEALEILSHNLSSLPSSNPPSLNPNIEHQVLDWSSPLPPNIKETSWELIVVADCTYNPDVVPDLVRTLKSLRDGNGEVGKEMMVLLAMKVRHESEMVFFELMKGSGFVVAESCRIPLSMLGGEGQEIEVFVFV